MKTAFDRKKYQDEYRATHKDQLREYARNRYVQNREEILKNNKSRYDKNKVRYLSQQKEYRTRNRSVILQRMSEYQKEHPEVWRRNVANYKSKHPERVKASKLKYQIAHKFENAMRCKARRAKMVSDTQTLEMVNRFYSWVRNQDRVSCAYCPAVISGRQAHLDHVIPVSRGGIHCYDNLCVSCPSCNRNKGNKLLSEWDRAPKHLIGMI